MRPVGIWWGGEDSSRECNPLHLEGRDAKGGRATTPMSLTNQHSAAAPLERFSCVVNGGEEEKEMAFAARSLRSRLEEGGGSIRHPPSFPAGGRMRVPPSSLGSPPPACGQVMFPEGSEEKIICCGTKEKKKES